jgi:hypothetical protein
VLPEAEQLCCIRDVGSVGALVPGTIVRYCIYIAGSDMEDEFLHIAFQVAFRHHHVFRQLNFYPCLMGSHGLIPAHELRQDVDHLRGLCAILSKTLSQRDSLPQHSSGESCDEANRPSWSQQH